MIVEDGDWGSVGKKDGDTVHKSAEFGGLRPRAGLPYICKRCPEILDKRETSKSLCKHCCGDSVENQLQKSKNVQEDVLGATELAQVRHAGSLMRGMEKWKRSGHILTLELADGS